MPVTSVNYAYRPPRIGWVIENDRAQLHRAMELSHMLLGGRFNPILPADDPTFADDLIRLFEIDLLWPVSDSDASKSLVERYSHLAWPSIYDGPFADGDERGPAAAQCLDVSHAIAHLRPKDEDGRERFALGCAQVRWDESDPLALAFMATFGAYSDPKHGLAYREMFESALSRKVWTTSVGEVLSPDFANLITPSSMTVQLLNRTRWPRWDHPGVYVGAASNVRDCVAFWNLRAAGMNVLFFDPDHAERLGGFVSSRLDQITLDQQARGQPVELGLWSGNDATPPSVLGERAWVRISTMRDSWNGGKIKPAQHALDRRSVLANVDDDGDRIRLTFDAPFESDLPDHVPVRHQHAVLSIRRPMLHRRSDDLTFSLPFLPELNEFYSRTVPPVYEQVRAEQDGIGVLVPLWQSHVTIQAVSARQLVEKVFATRGIAARPSHAGTIARRIVHHMGGIQDCRVFMFGGVRALLGSGSARTTFTVAEALKTIGTDFDKFKRLFIQPRDTGDLTPQEVLTFLAQRNVLKLGADLRCPTCELTFWRSLDDLRTRTACEYCDTVFHTDAQLTAPHHWRYRRSGLFARDDHQEGAIPVLATLRCLDSVLGTGLSGTVLGTGFDLSPAGASIDACESDFVYILQDTDGSVEFAIGECKASGNVDANDIAHLRAVANALATERLHPFVILAKTVEFTTDEIAMCRPPSSEPWRRDTILLGPEQLESYDFRLESAEPRDNRLMSLGLAGLAEMTHRKYFELSGGE